MVSGNNGDVFVVFNLFTKVDFLVVIGSNALSIFEDQFIVNLSGQTSGNPPSVGTTEERDMELELLQLEARISLGKTVTAFADCRRPIIEIFREFKQR